MVRVHFGPPCDVSQSSGRPGFEEHHHYYIIGLLITAPFFWKYIADTDFLRLPLSGQAELAYVLVLGTQTESPFLFGG